MDRLEEVTLREHFESRCDERTQGQNERLSALERVVNEREKRYLDKFESMESHIARSLAALNETHKEKQWSIGNILAALAISIWAKRLG